MLSSWRHRNQVLDRIQNPPFPLPRLCSCYFLVQVNGTGEINSFAKVMSLHRRLSDSSQQESSPLLPNGRSRDDGPHGWRDILENKMTWA